MTDHDVIEDDIVLVTLVAVLQDAGSLIVFETDDGRRLAVDHHLAQDIVLALDRGEDVEAQAAPWQFI